MFVCTYADTHAQEPFDSKASDETNLLFPLIYLFMNSLLFVLIQKTQEEKQDMLLFS